VQDCKRASEKCIKQVAEIHNLILIVISVSCTCCYSLNKLQCINNLPYLSSQVQHYILVVQAQDNGHPSLSSTLTVYCNVIDLNDNAPVFDPMSYSNEIYENVPIGTEVVTVSATDIDSGMFFAIFFTLFYKSIFKKQKLKIKSVN
jgi:hypothetical protein